MNIKDSSVSEFEYLSLTLWPGILQILIIMQLLNVLWSCQFVSICENILSMRWT